MPEEARKRREHRRGEGSVYQSNGVWMAAFTVGYRDGKRIRRKRASRDGTKKGAGRELAKLQRWYGHVGDVGTMTLGAYLDEWLEMVQPTVAPGSLVAYRGHVENHIKPLLGGIFVAELHQRDVRRLIRDRITAGKSAQTVVGIVSTLRSALAVAVRDGDLPANVAAGLDLPRVDRAPVEAMTPERATAILEAVKDDDHGSLYVTLLGTGLRLGEALALDWQDIDLDSGRLTVKAGKSRSARRSLPLPRFVVTALRKHKVAKGGRNGPVWAISKSTALRTFRGLLAEADVPYLTLHQLRHGTATLLLQRGVPMREISDILGHASPALTARTYAHVSEAQKRRAMSTLDEVGA